MGEELGEKRCVNGSARGSARPAMIIVMGTSASGKSTLALSLSHLLHIPFVDGDDLHPPSNVEKMSRGEPLTDEDRLPWLRKIRETGRSLVGLLEMTQANTSGGGPDPENIRPPSTEASKGRGRRRACLIACSSLKRAYRDVLRGEGISLTGTQFSTTSPEPTSSADAVPSSSADDLQTYFLYLRCSPLLLRRRLHARKGHFFKENMLESQLATLQEPTEDEVVAIAGEEDAKVELFLIEGGSSEAPGGQRMWKDAMVLRVDAPGREGEERDRDELVRMSKDMVERVVGPVC